MKKLVSIIIPCYNAARWLKEAIDSCLQQTYSALEIIVIDDGSTDNCLEIIKSYGERIIWKSGPNKGGNHARNRGFALSKGEYVQYLDADDYLLPEKIERQVRFLDETGADVVYGDWRYQQHLADGTSFLDEIQISGSQEDILKSLLMNWWTAPASILFGRAMLNRCDGWDESLKVGQDRDFIISLAIKGAKFVYQPGCYVAYRRYGNISVSTSNKELWLENHCILLEKTEVKLDGLNMLSPEYREALAHSYFSMATDFYDQMSFLQHSQLMTKGLLLCPNFKMKTNRSAAYYLVQEVFGFLVAEKFCVFKQQVKKKLLANQ